MAWTDFWLGQAEKITNIIPGVGPAISYIIGGFKDIQAGVSLDKKFSDLSKNFDDCRKGIDEANLKIETQGKALKGQIDGVKTELEGAIKQQGEKFDKEIKDLDKKIGQATGQMKKDLEKERQERKNEMAKQKQELESQIKEVTNQLEKAKEELKKELNDFKADVEKKFEEQEKKILENKKRIEEEKRQREAEIKKLDDKIKIAEQKTENLRQEHQEFKDQSEQKQNQLNRQISEAEQKLEDFEAETDSKFRTQKAQYEADLEDAKEELENKSRETDAKLKDTQEQISEHQEDLAHLHYEQKKQNILNQEIFENLQETNDILSAQQRKLNLVSQQMEDIQENVHLRMDKISKDVNQKTEQTLNIAKDASKKVDRLTKEVQQMRDDLENIEDQIKQNKEETEKIKQQAKQTNQRIDNLLKSQALMDFSAEQSNLDKIQKSLELKAEEAKLIATLNLLKETKNLVRIQANKEWLVGIKQGTETEKKGSEGMILDPNSSWAKKYSKEQLQEWGWDTRLFGEHEKAQLLSEDQDKKQQQQEQVQAEEQEGEEVPMTEQAQQVLEEVNKVQSEILKKLQSIQEEIAQNVQEVESAPPPSSSAPKPSATTALDIIKAESKVKIKKKALERQKQAEKEARQVAKSNPTKQNQKQVEEEKQETQKAETALQQAQEELTSLEKKQEFEEALEEKEKELEENQSEEINLQWQQIQALSQQALQENPDHEKPEETKEEDLQKKLEELVQQLQEQEVAQAASKKSMTLFMLYLIIFLMEYVVYKKNGLPGLIILNIILLVCYWYKDQIMEYWDLIGPYLLIIAYVAGNVLAYNSVENPDYKWPMVYGFNAVVGLVYAYTWWERWGAKQKANQIYQSQMDNLRKEFKVNTEEWEQIQAQSKKSEPKTWTERISHTVSQSPYNIYSDDFATHTQEINNFQTFVHQREEAEKKEAEMTKQAETLQKAAAMEQQLKGNLEQIQEGLKEPPISWQLIREKYPEHESRSTFLTELAKSDKLEQFDPRELKELREWLEDLENEPAEEKEREKKKHKVYLRHFTEEFANIRKEVLEKLKTIKTKSIVLNLNRLPLPSEEEIELLVNLPLTTEQYIAISLKTPHLTWEEKNWLVNYYSSLTHQAKLQLLSAGLNALELNTYEKKEQLFKLLINLQGEQKLFGLTVKEKEQILRFMMNTLDLTKQQQDKLEDMGIKPYNASEWTVTEEQKDHLLDFGLNRLELTEEQAEQLEIIHPDQFKTFSLTGDQKNILNSLSPLIKEDKYSLESLELLKSLHLKSSSQSFLVQEEIIPDPYTQFGTVKSNYLPLKIKFLQGEQKTLLKIKELQEKALKEEEIKQNKLSILHSLMEFANNRGKNKNLNLNLTLDNWVKKGVFKEWQKDILLTIGFKTIPKYNFFEILIFAIKNFETEPITDNQEEQDTLKTQQLEEIITQILIILDAWRDKSTGKKKEAIKKAIKQLSNENLPEEQEFNRMNLLLSSYPNNDKKLNSLVEIWKGLQSPIITGSLALYLEDNPNLKESYRDWIYCGKNQTLTINKEIWEKYASTSRISSQASTENLYELIDERVKNILGGYEPETDWEKWKDISLDFNPYLIQDWKDQGFAYETTKEWIDIGLTVNDANFAAYLKGEVKLSPEEVLNTDQQTELRKQFEEYKTIIRASKTSPSSTNKYDDLLANLEGEERERERKRLEREESRRKLEESELTRRQSKLSEKDRKLKEAQEKRQKEKELAEQEEKKRDEARSAREQALKEEQEAYFATQQKNLDERQKKAEENFANQQKEAEIAETKKKAQIEELEKQNKFQAEQIEKAEKLLEEETKKKLEKIAVDDLKARQEILKQQEAAKVRLEEEKRENEQELEREKAKKEEELEKLKEKNRSELAKGQTTHELEMNKLRAETENLQKAKEQMSQQTETEIKEHMKKMKAQHEQEMEVRRKTEFEASRARAKGQRVIDFNKDKSDAISAIKYYSPTRTDIQNGFRTSNSIVPFFQTDGRILFQVHKWVSNYPGATINISKWSSAGIADESRQNLGGGTSQPDADSRRVSRIGNWLGDTWLTWEEVEKRINEAGIEEMGKF